MVDQYTRRFLEGKTRREQRRRLTALQKFQRWLHGTYGIEPKTLVVEARRRSNGPDKVDRILREYCKFLTDERKYAKTSVSQWRALLGRFFSTNFVSLSGYPHKPTVRPVYEKVGVPSQESVKEMVRSRDSLRDRYVIAFLAQSGQRIGVLTAMKRKMITRVDSGHGIIKVPRTFLNPLRVNVNELELPYAFIIGRDTMRLLDELPTYEGGWLLDISQRQMARVVDETARAVRIQEKERTDIGRSWSTVHPNTFRKYWSRRMIKAGNDHFLVMYMMGYRVPKVFGPYEPSDEELLEAYKRAESMLEVL